MYEQKEGIPKSVYIQDSRKDAKEAAKKHNLGIKYFISYETLCGAIIKRDFVFKKYGFGYSNKMQKRIEEVCNKWKNL
jgi:predicted phosphoadenosine phosphosulfate sulfurtransferase